MAKIGDTDARWIVSERTDGKNVGNWHWSEYNLLPFFKQTLPAEIEGNEITNGTLTATITLVDKVEGDFNAMNRKGKTIFVWDMNLTLKWKGTIEGTEYTGSVEVAEIYNDEDGPYRISARSDKDLSEVGPLKELLRKQLNSAVKPAIDRVIVAAKEQINVQAPVEVKRVIAEDKPVVVRSQSTSTTTTNTTLSSSASKTATSTIKQTITFEVPPAPLYETLTDERRVQGFTGSPAQIVAKAGGAFTLLGGAVSGEMITVEENKKVVQKWRFNSWPENHYSQVTMEFEDQGGRTKLTLTQTGVPSADLDRTTAGWEEYFWKRIRGMFGWGYKLR